jgi:hypothetical protein
VYPFGSGHPPNQLYHRSHPLVHDCHRSPHSLIEPPPSTEWMISCGSSNDKLGSIGSAKYAILD